jgi:hypothetical protein
LEEECEWNTNLEGPRLRAEVLSARNIDDRLRRRHWARNNLKHFLVVNGQSVVVGIVDEDFNAVVSSGHGSASREERSVEHLTAAGIVGCFRNSDW